MVSNKSVDKEIILERLGIIQKSINRAWFIS